MTMDTEPVLSEEKLAVFRRNGFVFVPQMFGPRDMAHIERWTDEPVAYPEVPGRHMVYRENSLLEKNTRVLSHIENFCAYHQELPGLLGGGHRRVLYMTYNRAAEGDHRARYYTDKRKSYPPDCERDPDKRYVFRV